MIPTFADRQALSGDRKKHAQGVVLRNVLNDLFFANLHRKLTLVEAPAGYGKTTLMEEWRTQLAHRGERTIWLQIGADAVQTLTVEERMLQALTHIGKDCFEQSPLSSDSMNLDGDSSLSTIVGLLGSHSSKTFIFLDDVHECAPEEAEFIHLLLLHLGDKIHMVIGSRETPGFPLTKLRLEEQITDFGVENLRLNRSEVAELLGDHAQVATLDAIFDYTEGWVAAVQMLRQAGAAEMQLDLAIDKNFGGQAGIADYLNEQFFEQLTKEQQAFLVDTAHLGTINGDLADYIRQSVNSWDVLEGLAKAHSLVFEVSGMTPAYRYHQLLRDFLRKRQIGLGQDRVRGLNLRTAEWCFDNDRLTSAVRHALIANRPDRAIEMILQAGGVQIGIRQGAPRLKACLDQIPMQLVHQTPRLMIARAYLLLKGARMDEAAGYLGEVRRTISPSDEEAQRELVMVEAHQRVYQDEHLTENQLASLEHIARITPASDELVRGLFANFLCHFQMQTGNLVHARKYGENAMEIYTDLGIAHLQFFMYLHLSVIDLDTGDFAGAYSRRCDAVELAKKFFPHDPALCALADIYYCEIAFEMGQFDGLELRLSLALERASKAEGWSEAFLAGYETCLSLSFSNHDYDSAVHYIVNAEATATRRASRRFARHLHILELELALDSGLEREVERLSALIETMLGIQESRNKLRWRGRILARHALCRAYAMSGRFDHALALLSDVRKDCYGLGLRRYLLRTEVLQVIIAAQAKDWSLANQSLVNVLAYADPDFPGALMRHSIAFSTAARECVHKNGVALYSKEQTHKLAKLLWVCSGHKPVDTPSLLSELLTAREYSVLEGIACGDANKVIARKLDLSEATVKFHVKNIFVKLGVNSRKLAAEIALAHGVKAASSA